LVADYLEFERKAHFRYIPLPGGDAAVRQTWRPGLSWLRESFGRDLPEVPALQCIPEKQLAIVHRMLEQNLNTVMTSSCGRLFDAVSALLGIRTEATFEGQAAIELENAAAPGIEEHYAFDIVSGHPAQIDLRPVIRAVVGDLRLGLPIGVISSRFHNSIAAVILEMCQQIRQTDTVRRVCLSGGTFQNSYLLERVVRLLNVAGFEVFLHSAVPPNDGGIALGQALIANEKIQSGV
jgi:hydrogenase maturation protein HypF